MCVRVCILSWGCRTGFRRVNDVSSLRSTMIPYNDLWQADVCVVNINNKRVIKNDFVYCFWICNVKFLPHEGTFLSSWCPPSLRPDCRIRECVVYWVKYQPIVSLFLLRFVWANCFTLLGPTAQPPSNCSNSQGDGQRTPFCSTLSNRFIGFLI